MGRIFAIGIRTGYGTQDDGRRYLHKARAGHAERLHHHHILSEDRLTRNLHSLSTTLPCSFIRIWTWSILTGHRKNLTGATVRRYHVTDAAVHDSQTVDQLLTRGNSASGVWTDAAYRSEEVETKLKTRGLVSRIHRKGKRGKPLGKQARQSSKTKSSVRVRPSRACKSMHCRAMVEHVFGAQANDMGGTLVRTIGLARAKAKIGMKNLAYNIRRLGQLRRINSCPA